MKKNLLAELILTGVFLILPQTISNSSSHFDLGLSDNTTEISKLTNLEIAGLEVYGEDQKALGIDFFGFYRLVFSDKPDILDPLGFDNVEKKTEAELKRGLELKNNLENRYAILFKESRLDTPDNNWGKLINGKLSITKGTYQKRDHEALDIFSKEGNEVLAPFNGVVVASGDYWQGSFKKDEMINWNNKGLTPRAGNSIIIYNATDNGYLLLSHLKEGLLVKAGDIVTKGQIVGYVGNSGSAARLGHGKHVHAAYKIRDNEGFLIGIDFTNLVKK
jgi:murein DD-endopeptidase MepM/ murein hydrolase activator NlpD